MKKFLTIFLALLIMVVSADLALAKKKAPAPTPSQSPKSPAASAEICDDTIDNDLDGLVDCADRTQCSSNPACKESCDADLDGYTNSSCGGQDCDDTNHSIYPAAPEICGDSVDNNCNGKADEGCL